MISRAYIIRDRDGFYRVRIRFPVFHHVLESEPYTDFADAKHFALSIAHAVPSIGRITYGAVGGYRAVARRRQKELDQELINIRIAA